MSKVIRISENTYQRLQKIAKPFDDTPDTVIQNVLEFYETEKLGKTNGQEGPINGDILILDINDPVDLTHTKILDGHFNNEPIRSWRELVSVAHRIALHNVGSFNELRKITMSNIYKGEKIESGFKPINGTNISLQGASANISWNNALNLAKRFRKPIKMEFKWRDKKGVRYPNRTGLLKWEPK